MKNTELPVLKIYHRWYVRTPGKSEVVDVVIRELTEKTVLLELLHTSFGIQIPNEVKRFVTTEVKWIEKK